MSFPNVYAHRKVADTAMKGCDICYRPTSSVLLSDGEGGKDFFFVCPSHIKDRKFCTPIVDQDAAEAKRKKEMEEEVERVKKEYEEKKKKKEAEKKKEDEKEDESSGDKKKDEDKDKDKKEDKKAVGDAESQKRVASPASSDEEHRFFALQRVFYSQRIAKKREAEMARRNRERLQQPNLFPSVPKNLPGA